MGPVFDLQLSHVLQVLALRQRRRREAQLEVTRRAWGGSKPAPQLQLPFFLDPLQIEALTPEIDWDKRVGDRIRAMLTGGAP